MRKYFLVFAVAIGLVACPASPQGSNDPELIPQPSGLGLLEVTIDLRSNDAQASVLTPSRSSAVSTRTATTLPQATTGIEVNRVGVGFHDDEVANFRYVYATFQIENNTGSILNNFTTWALDVPTASGQVASPTKFGTMMVAISNGAGVAITDGNVFRNLQPVHGIRPNAGGIELNPNNADLQFFSSAETAEVASQLTATYQVTTASVLGYGYVARDAAGTGRTIGATNGTPGAVNSCSQNSCRGFITLAFKLPVLPLSSAGRNTRSAVFSFIFALGNQSVGYATQSPDEQTQSTIAGQTPAAQSLLSRILPGSKSLYTRSNLENLCQVTTARADAVFTSPVLLPATIPTLAGSLDTCYWASGSKGDSFGGTDQGRAATLDSSNRMLVVGNQTTPTIGQEFALRRFLANGSLDTSFGTGGSSSGGCCQNATSQSPRGVAVDSNGDIIVVGQVAQAAGAGEGTDLDFSVAKFNSSGVLINSSVISDNPFNLDDNIVGVDTVGTDVFVIGTQGISNSRDLVVWKFKSSTPAVAGGNLVIDSTFGVNGKSIILDVGDEVAGGIDAISSTQIYAVGTKNITVGTGNWYIVKLGASGGLDTTFNTTGKLQISFPGFPNTLARAIKVDTTGRIVVGGDLDDGFGRDFAVGRFLSTGAVDLSFNTTGFNFGFPPATGGDSFGKALVLDSSNNIVLAGETAVAGIPNFGCARFAALDGAVTFPCQTTNISGASTNNILNAAMRSSDGKLYMVGDTTTAATTRIGIARFNAP
jgi:uncharacterized delta-60 repeat protein